MLINKGNYNYYIYNTETTITAFFFFLMSIKKIFPVNTIDYEHVKTDFIFLLILVF